MISARSFPLPSVPAMETAGASEMHEDAFPQPGLARELGLEDLVRHGVLPLGARLFFTWASPRARRFFGTLQEREGRIGIQSEEADGSFSTMPHMFIQQVCPAPRTYDIPSLEAVFHLRSVRLLNYIGYQGIETGERLSDGAGVDGDLRNGVWST